MVTIKDIAQSCGVSIAAVSKALNNSRDISEETKNKIKERAKLLGYAPNTYARMLKTNRSHNIGILFDDDTNNGFGHAFFSKVLTAIRQELETKRYDITFIARNSFTSTGSYLARVKQKRLDGVIVADVDYNDEKVRELLEGDIPSVAIDYISDQCNCVYSDNFAGMYELTKYCCEQGHRRIAFIRGQDTCITGQRMAGFKAALQDCGVPLREEDVIAGEYYNIEVCCERFRQLFELPVPPSCVMISDDYSLFGVQKAAYELGLNIPAHVSVVGYDDIAIAKYFLPPLTTVRQDADKIGRTAVKLLLDTINGHKKEVESAIIPTKLVVRGSVRTIESKNF